MDLRLDMIDLHNTLHGCCVHRGTGTAVIEAKSAQQLTYFELQPFYGVLLDLRKVFDAVDWGHCLMLLEGYGAGPQMIRLSRTYWQDAIMVCHASGNYGQPFKAGHGVTQGGPLSARLFNILVDAVICKWYRLLKTQVDYEAPKLDKLIATFFAIFYVDDAYLALKDAEFLQ